MKKVVVGIISKKCASGELEYLLVKARRDFGEFTGCWYPPGGHVEEGEELREALKREVKEELGIEVEPSELLAKTAGDVIDQTTYWFACSFDEKEKIIPDDKELESVGFFSFEEMKAMRLWPATKDFFVHHPELAIRPLRAAGYLVD